MKETATSLCRASLFTDLPTMHEKPQCALPANTWYQPLILAVLVGGFGVSSQILFCISLMTDDVEWFSVCFLAIGLSSSMKFLF